MTAKNKERIVWLALVLVTLGCLCACGPPRPKTADELAIDRMAEVQRSWNAKWDGEILRLENRLADRSLSVDEQIEIGRQIEYVKGEMESFNRQADNTLRIRRATVNQR